MDELEICAIVEIEKEKQAFSFVLSELRKAEQKHPTWPEDIVHAVAIMGEEAGESIQAALNYYYHGGDIELLKKELGHTGAVVIRCLKNLP